MTTFLSFIFGYLGWSVTAVAIVAAIALYVFSKVLPSWFAPLIIALMGVSFGGYYLAEQAKASQTALAHQQELQKLKDEHSKYVLAVAAQNEANAQQSLANEKLSRETERNVGILLSKYEAKAKEVTNYERQESIRRRSADRSGHLRVRVAATCSGPVAETSFDSGMPDPAASTGSKDGATCELTPSARQDLLDLRDQINADREKLIYFQDRERLYRSTVDGKQP